MRSDAPLRRRVSLAARLWLPALCSLLLAPSLFAQWQSTNYSLKGGWNAIYLHGDATHATPATLFAANPEVLEVWRWNPNPNQVGFTSSPLVPSPGTPEWTVWKSDLSVTALTQMIGQTAYLVKCAGTTANTYTVTLPQKILPPSATWVRNGANLLGFPTKLNGTYPLFSNYFSTYPAAIAANVKIFKYAGGDLGAANPIQVFSPSTERLDRNQAYWFDAEVVGSFYAPVELSVSNSTGLDFGRTGSIITVRVLNRSATASTITIAPVASNAAPSGQEAVTASVPVTRRTFDSGTNTWTETLISTSYTEVVGPNASVELSFGIDRAHASMTGAAANAFFASLLRFTDSANLYQIDLPVRARKASLAGLWIGEAQVGGVESKAAGYTGTATSRKYPLRYIIHVDDAGTARVLSQVFMGKLAPSPYDFGICTKEAGLKPDTKDSASRIVAAHMPLDSVLDGVADVPANEPTAGSGTFSLGGTLTRTIFVPFDDKVSPFVHQYHPDHDNNPKKTDPNKGQATLVSGQESWDVSRAISFTIAATAGAAPVGTSVTGYGSTLLAGTYAETITGLRKDAIAVTGTFELRRVSEIGSITITP